MRSSTYLLTYTVGSVSIKPAISSKRLKIERKLLLTAHNGLSIAGKMYDLEWPPSEIQGHWFLKCRKNDEIQETRSQASRQNTAYSV